MKLLYVYSINEAVVYLGYCTFFVLRGIIVSFFNACFSVNLQTLLVYYIWFFSPQHASPFVNCLAPAI
uniref:Uncharacterized protein n=1 Tax=Rhizophora mucronata TaxID=61149 RepID=A0A2P2Q837_RHIMU